jgi:hypothetical protein
LARGLEVELEQLALPGPAQARWYTEKFRIGGLVHQ